MVDLTKLNTQQVGKCGELLVQYELLKHGIESAPMTTDYGVDLVAVQHGTQKAVTIQVKASTHHLGQDGSKWLTWSMPNECKAEYVAVVDVERNKIWLFTKKKFEDISIGESDGRWLWWYVPDHKPERTTITRSEQDFTDYEFDTAVQKVFP